MRVPHVELDTIRHLWLH